MEKSQKIKILTIISLVIFALTLIFLKLTSKKEIEIKVQEKEEKAEIKQLSTDELKKVVPFEIDSILYQYGIKPEWIKNILNTKKKKK
ncbi:MAG: hypothetical protein NTU73_00640 [Ignavibacteriae bacterium]|nr:hypothetical protein [Ignavibacteriota bacterium]